MINGQMSMIAVPMPTQPVIPEPVLRVAVATETASQVSGTFAELLNGISQQTKTNSVSELQEIEALQNNDLLAQLNVPPQMSPATETDAQKPDDSEKQVVSQLIEQPLGAPSEVTSQMLLAAYSQPGRMPEVNLLAKPDIAGLQNVAEAAEQPGITSVPAVKSKPEQPSAMEMHPQLQGMAPAVNEKTAAEQAVGSKQERHPESDGKGLADEKSVDLIATSTRTVQTATAKESTPVNSEVSFKTVEVNKPTVLNDGRQQNAAVPTEQKATVIATAAKTVLPAELSEIPVSRPVSVPVATTLTQLAPPTDQTEADLKTVEVNKPTVLNDGRPQNAAIIAADGKIQSGQFPAEPTHAKPESAPNPVKLTEPVTSLFQESEPEMQAAEHLAIAARLPAAAALTDSRAAAQTAELRNTQPQLNPEQLIEKDENGDDLNVGKEKFSALTPATQGGETAPDFGTSTGGGDNQPLAQNMSGQFKTEHQTVASSLKPAQSEPARQDLPEQVVHQVKERLGQHDLKPGSQQITLTLSPDSLGELKMNLNLQGQKLSVEILTESRAVRDVILQHTEALKESLARQNITMESFDVTTGGKGSGNQGQNQGAWRELAKQQQQQFLTSARGYQTAQPDLPSRQASYQRQQGQSMLDIHY